MLPVRAASQRWSGVHHGSRGRSVRGVLDALSGRTGTYAVHGGWCRQQWPVFLAGQDDLLRVSDHRRDGHTRWGRCAMEATFAKGTIVTANSKAAASHLFLWRRLTGRAPTGFGVARPVISTLMSMDREPGGCGRHLERQHARVGIRIIGSSRRQLALRESSLTSRENAPDTLARHRCSTHGRRARTACC